MLKLTYNIIHFSSSLLLLSLFAPTLKAEIRWDKGCDLTVNIKGNTRPVLSTALEMFNSDIEKVLSGRVSETDSPNADIIINIDPAKSPKNQSFTISSNPTNQLVITAHDSHGAAYALMELSRIAGVSPWEWWADSTPQKRDSISFADDFQISAAPDVEYRGIFINDEDWGLNPWSWQNYDPAAKGTIGPKTTARIFELLMRLRANTYWPPMHECTVPFFLTPGNREVAEKYGIYIGGSHCEPMASSTAGEWPRRGEGEYNYVKNSDKVKDFWEKRLNEVDSQEIIYTLGMRGVHDSSMLGVKTTEEHKDALTRVIADQREMLAKHGLTDAPQVFIPYKEVLDIYNAGLDIPEDVTLIWCDDNYGYIRHFPDSIEKNRPGGNGIYYHVSYWGRPHDYLWLGTFSPGILHQQMGEAYRRGIDRMWILNVGDIKPAEYQIELFMDMAWDFDEVERLGLDGHYHNFLNREFAKEAADKLLPVMKDHYRLAFIRKPEFMGNTRTEERTTDYYNHVRDLPWSEDYMRQRMSDYDSLSDIVEEIATAIPTEKKDTYFHLVKYPVQGATQMNRRMLGASLARHGLADWGISRAAYDSIQNLTLQYNTPKWKGIMDSHPRKLPVFMPVKEESGDSIPLPTDKTILKLNAKEGEGYLKTPQWLGYEYGAAELAKDKDFDISFSADLPEEATIILSFIPTHNVGSDNEGVNLTIDGKDYGPIYFETYGRSEEWKENVLNNHAVRSIPVRFSAGSSHSIIIRPLSEGVILDQIIIH